MIGINKGQQRVTNVILVNNTIYNTKQIALIDNSRQTFQTWLQMANITIQETGLIDIRIYWEVQLGTNVIMVSFWYTFFVLQRCAVCVCVLWMVHIEGKNKSLPLCENIFLLEYLWRVAAGGVKSHIRGDWCWCLALEFFQDLPFNSWVEIYWTQYTLILLIK